MLVVLVFAVVEGLAYAAGRMIARRGFVYRLAGRTDYADYRARRDPLLGWPAPDTIGTGEIDARGSRIVPSFPDPAMPSCVALFGDSFTWGSEVVPEHAYGNVLAQRLGCRVANYGVPGYGTDQAFLRFRDRIVDPAPVVVLGHFSENIVRNVNRFRGFLSGTSVGLKPRFEMTADGRLDLLPALDLTADEHENLWRRPDLIPHEYFVPGGPSGLAVLRFPYTMSLVRTFGHLRFGSTRDGLPWYAPFYDASHPSGAFPVTLDIVRAFWREAVARGQRPVVALIPDEHDLIALRGSGRTSYAPLESALRVDGIRVPAIAAQMITTLGTREPCAFYARCGGSHMNREGYAELARIVGDWIVAEDVARGSR